MNGIFLIDKPAGMTSFDVIAVLRKKLGIKKIGHTGTLDPNATGLMMILVGKATKLLPYIDNQTKTYHAQLRFGLKTHTGDIWGEVLETKEVCEVSEKQVQATFKQFLGQQQQMPPMVSAISVNGKRLYEYARQSIEVERKPRTIEIFDLHGHILADGLEFVTHCSSGTYIRTLCEDLAHALNNIASMSYLRRTSIAHFTLQQASNLMDLDPAKLQWLNEEEVIGLPVIEVEDNSRFKDGKTMSFESPYDTVIVKYQGELVAVYSRVSDSTYKSVRGLW